MSSSFALFPHQQKALDWIRSNETKKSKSSDFLFHGGILGMAMGLGKTFTMLTHIVQVRSSLSLEQRQPTLILCPKTALFTWKSEIEKFFGSELKILIFRSDEIKMELVKPEFINQFDIVLTNYEYVRSIANKLKIDRSPIFSYQKGKKKETLIGVNVPDLPLLQLKSGDGVLYSINWYRIVADESHNFANNSTSLWRAVMGLCSSRRWGLSGTPIRNWGDDLYSQFKFLGYQDTRLNLKEFQSCSYLKSYLFYLDYELADIKLPQLHHHQIPVELKEQQAAIYKFYLDHAIEAYEQFIIGCVKFDCVLVAFLRLRQSCIAPFTIVPDSQRNYNPTEEERISYERAQKHFSKSHPHLVTWLHQRDSSAGLQASKIQTAINIIKKVPKGEKIIVFTMFKRVIDLLRTALDMRQDEEDTSCSSSIHIDGDIVGKMRDLSLATFKKQDHCNILFISYKIGAESLNLSEANHIILMEPWWCPAVIEQAKARCHRMGQTKETHIYELFINKVHISRQEIIGSIEEAIIKLCKQKIEVAQQFYKEGKPLKGQQKSSGLSAQDLAQILYQ